MFSTRTETLIKTLQGDGIQGALVHKPSNIRYLSGYTGEGILLITQKLCAIITDFRYTEQAQKQAPGYSVHMISTGLSHVKLAAELLLGSGVDTLAVEEDEVTVSAMRDIKAAMPGITFAPMALRPEKQREIKDASETCCIGKACEITCRAFEHMLTYLRPGLTERDAKLELESALYRFGGESIAFDTIIAAGPNGSLPHAIPSDYVMQPGDFVTLDFGATYGGYCADMTRTVALGKPDADKLHIYETVLDAQLRALDALKPGAICRDVDAVARKVIDEAGYKGRFGHGLGHSLGLDIHENPRLSMTCGDVLRPGHVMTVEPGIYLPGTAGVRIEDSCLVTEEGYRIFTPVTKELIQL